MFLDEAQLVRAEVPFLIYVRDSSHEGAQDDFGVVLWGDNTPSPRALCSLDEFAWEEPSHQGWDTQERTDTAPHCGVCS